MKRRDHDLEEEDEEQKQTRKAKSAVALEVDASAAEEYRRLVSFPLSPRAMPRFLLRLGLLSRFRLLS